MGEAAAAAATQGRATASRESAFTAAAAAAAAAPLVSPSGRPSGTAGRERDSLAARVALMERQAEAQRLGLPLKTREEEEAEEWEQGDEEEEDEEGSRRDRARMAVQPGIDPTGQGRASSHAPVVPTAAPEMPVTPLGWAAQARDHAAQTFSGMASRAPMPEAVQAAATPPASLAQQVAVSTPVGVQAGGGGGWRAAKDHFVPGTTPPLASPLGAVGAFQSVAAANGGGRSRAATIGGVASPQPPNLARTDSPDYPIASRWLPGAAGRARTVD
jgi:hypothetical protein